MDSEEARRALQDVNDRREQVAAEMARLHPPVWSLAVFVLGYYAIFAGLDFAFPVPLACFGAGALLMAGGLLVAFKHEGKYGVKGPRDLWDTPTVTIAVVWLVVMLTVFGAGRAALAGAVPEGVTSVLAALPLAVLAALMVRWICRRAYGTAVR